MPDPSDTDPLTIRHFILYEALLKTPVFEGFKNLCKAVGDDVIKYSEYDFWYYRFLSGKRDFHYDRSNDAKPIEFSDLPSVVLNKIVENLDVKNRFNLRKVSHSLRQAIDQQKMNLELIEIEIQHNSVSIGIDNFLNEYFGDFMKDAENDWRILLKSLRNVKEFRVEIDASFEPFFNKSIDKIRTSEVYISTARSKEALEILEFFEPEILTHVEMKSRTSGNIDFLFEMEQFKKAQYMSIDDLGTTDFAYIDRFFHFKGFDITLPAIRAEDLLKIRDAMVKFAEFHTCYLFFNAEYDQDEIGEELGAELNDRSYVLKVPAAQPNTFVEVIIDSEFVLFSKIF
ncbi:hypothetical protein B9Z55_026837 [Caenorhabditis nigoni]|uniref:F-box domain-containing protein n=1 Tax=Caenorhabditis nigoni TaxID=1611254 RepID=A0A2G5SHI0_9PELO|nr:hypothetical protein B9Z55_026837 [Caenorhabditis nigoni]